MNRNLLEYLSKPALALCLSLGLLLAAGTSRAANLVTNGDFENEPNYGPTATQDFTGSGYVVLTGAQMPGWTIETGHGVTVHHVVGQPTISGVFSVNMDGEGFNSNNANFYQDIPTANGTTYQLDYDYAGWFFDATPRLNISVEDLSNNNLLINDFHSSDGSLVPHHVTLFFTGTGGNVRLRVDENPQTGGNDNQHLVDNFSVQAVPEPASLALAGVALIGLIAAARRRRSR